MQKTNSRFGIKCAYLKVSKLSCSDFQDAILENLITGTIQIKSNTHHSSSLRPFKPAVAVLIKSKYVNTRRPDSGSVLSVLKPGQSYLKYQYKHWGFVLLKSTAS